jgi:hypothetical protein
MTKSCELRSSIEGEVLRKREKMLHLSSMFSKTANVIVCIMRWMFQRLNWCDKTMLVFEIESVSSWYYHVDAL